MSARNLARLAGVLYLIVAISGGFAQIVSRSSVLVAGDAVATAEKIRASEGLVRIGFVADVVNIVAFLGVGLLLYVVLAPSSRAWSRAFLVLNAIAVAIMGVDLAFHAGALQLATDPQFAATLGSGTADAFAGLFLAIHSYGYLVAEVFFGLWLLPLGYAVYRSGALPRWLGIGLMVGAASYMASFVASVSSFEMGTTLAMLLAIPAGLSEFALMGWLLVRGADVPSEGTAPLPAAGAVSPAPAR